MDWKVSTFSVSQRWFLRAWFTKWNDNLDFSMVPEKMQHDIT